MEEYIKIKNAGTGRVTYRVPHRHVKRKLLPQMEIEVPFDEIKEGLYETGIRSLFSAGILEVVDKSAAEELGLTVGSGIVTHEPATKDVIIEKLKGSNGELAKFLKTASPTVKENVGVLAVELRIVDPGKVRIIEQQTGVNVLTALKRQDDMKAVDTTEEE